MSSAAIDAGAAAGAVRAPTVQGSAALPAAAPAPASTPTLTPRQGSSLWTIRQVIPRRVYLLLALVGLVAPLAGWALLAASGVVDAVFMPGPATVLARIGTWWSEDNLIGDIGISVLRVVLGWALAALIALPLGLAIGTWRAAQALLEPLTEFVRYMPAVAFVPLVMLWVGIDEAAKVAIIFLGSFFQMVLVVADEVRRVPMAQIEAAQTMGATRSEIIEKVVVPSAKPGLVDALRISMGCAWTFLVVAELVAANSGLGFAILKAQRFLQTDKIFAGILLIGLIGLVIDQLFRFVHRRAFPWLYGRH